MCSFQKISSKVWAITGLFILFTVVQIEAWGQVSYVYPPSEYNQGRIDDPNQRQIYAPAGSNQIVSFDHSYVSGVDVILPTTLDFGPDDKLYVGQQLGLITVYSIVRNGEKDYAVTDEEKIRLVKQDVDNHDDDGVPNSSIVDNPAPKHDNDLDNERQITGILATGTPSSPILYVTSSDPRHGAGVDGNNDSGLDTNSGVISRLYKEGGVWKKLDLVRGLPRSEENHSVNGLELDEVNNILYVAVGGLTNGGSPSNNFARITEYALSAAILKVDLDAIDAMPVQGSGNTAYVYDMPTLDDPTRTNVNGITDPNMPGYDGVDVNDPFGGNNGLNQSKIVPGGPVQLHATGFRNPYDVLIMESPGYEGKMYSIDNGSNQGWGGHPIGEGSYPGAGAGQCTNAYDPLEPGSTGPGPNDGQVNNLNGLHYIREVDAGNRYYAGHPAPIRGNPTGAGLYTFFDGSGVFRTGTTGPNPLPADWPPVPESEGYAAECDFRNSGVDDGSLVDYEPSTNGMAEYTASNFEGEIQGAILSAGYSGEIFIAKLNAAGDAVTNGVETLFSSFGSNPLDLIAQGDGDVFPGTVWAVTYLDNTQAISVFEPVNVTCAGGPGEQDDDLDGYSNNDEIANGTNECSAADKPTDNDGDFISDLTDTDDDNDGIDDVDDFFAIDDVNGIGTSIPLNYDLFAENPGTGFFGIGFTGLMTNGSTDYLTQFDPNEGIYGGTAGLVTVPNVSTGDAFEGQNSQDNAFQFGIDVDSNTQPFIALTSIMSPFFNTAAPQAGQSQGFYIGSGDQDNYLKVVLAANGGNGGIEVLYENAGSATSTMYGNNLSGDQQIPDDVLGAQVSLNLMVMVDPAAGTALPGYKVDTGDVVYLGSPISLTGDLLDALQNGSEALAVGIISSAPSGALAFTATWDRIEVAPVANTAFADITVAPPEDINESTVSGGSIKIQNTSTAGQKISSITLDLSTALLPDVVFDPDGTAGDNTGKGFTVNQGQSSTGYTSATMESPHNGIDGDDGYDAVTANFTDFDPGDEFAFSIDVDPTSIKGASAPGPSEAGSVSGLELSRATVTVNFDDGSSYSSYLYRIPGSVSGSQGFVGVEIDKPTISIPGASTLKLKVDDLEQTIRVAGDAGQDVKLLVVETGLFLPGDGGYDIDAFEANSIIAIQEFEGSIDGSGFVDFDITLGNSQSEGGINYAVAVFEDGDGKTGDVSDVVVLDYDPDGVATTIVRINSGGPAATVNGVDWEADANFSGGGTFSNVTEISGTDSDVIYQTERFDANASGLVYNIPVPGDGNYNVTLHFAEIFFGAPGGGENLGGAGKRVFSIDIEGQANITDLDIYDEVGAAAALVYVFENITVTDGALEIAMTSSVREGKLSGIEVSTLGDPSPVTAAPNPINFYAAEVGGSSNPRTVTISNNGSDPVTVTGISFSGADGGEFTSSFTSSLNIAAGASESVDVSFAPTSDGQKAAQMEIAFTGGSGSPSKLTVNGEGQSVNNGEVLYRVNAGGEALKSLDGKRVWTEDQTPFVANALGQANVGSPSPFVNSAGAGDHTFGTLDPVTLDATVPTYVPAEVFQTERWDPATEPNQLWSFAVPVGNEVEIRVYLAEIFLTADINGTQGPRVFDIAVDGVVPAVFDNIDVFAEVGHDVGIMKSFMTTSDGVVDLEVSKDGGENFAAVKAIEIIDPTLVSNESEDSGIPETFRLVGNYPNPFNPTTNVVFEVPQAALVSVEIYDVMGRKVMDVPAQNFAPGAGQVTIEASALSSGIYLYRVIAEMGSQVEVKAGRMTFVK